MRGYWLQRIQGFLQTDFIEYNARPYQGYSLRALQNLYSYAQDPSVKTAARMVLDYVSIKVATSSSDGRRAVPYRRKAEYNTSALIGFRADPQSARMLVLAGNLDMLQESPRHAAFGPWYGQDDMQLAIESDYRIPDHILEAMFDSDHRTFYQGFHHYADELYAASPSYLLSAGGHYATSAYKAAGIFGKDDDIGMALPTTVMPTGLFISRDALIRFDGVGDNTRRSNMCVAPNFACGVNPNLQAALDAAALKPSCVVVRDWWTFVNFTAGCRPGTVAQPFGFYAAVYQRTDDLGIPPASDPFPTGFVELLDTHLHPDVAFYSFWQGALARNGGRAYGALASSNTYVTTDGHTIAFELAPDSRILSLDGAPPAVVGSALAPGTLVHSPASGLVTIDGLSSLEQLVLDDRDASGPQEYTLAPVQKSGAREFGLGYQCVDGVGTVSYGVINPPGNWRWSSRRT